MDINVKLAKEFGLRSGQVEKTIQLIDEGNTVPFIARYRKEVTGGLTDVTLRELDERLAYLRNLEARKEEVLKLIEEQGKLTEDLKRRKSCRGSKICTNHTKRKRRPGHRKPGREAWSRWPC